MAVRLTIDPKPGDTRTFRVDTGHPTSAWKRFLGMGGAYECRVLRGKEYGDLTIRREGIIEVTQAYRDEMYRWAVVEVVRDSDGAVLFHTDLD